jgi:hypothetical protein
MTFKVEALGFHVGLVVKDAMATAEAYQRLLGGTTEMIEFKKPASKAIDPTSEDSMIRLVYGRFGGVTLEILQVLSGNGHHAKWLEQHGESVSHIGFWVPDVVEATRRALTQGATLRAAALSEEGLGCVSVTGAPVDTVARALLPGTVYVAYTPACDLEFVGPAEARSMAATFGEIITPSPWAQVESSEGQPSSRR